MKILMRHGARKGASKSAIAIRLHYLPFKLQWKREEILKKIKSNQDKYGVTNQAVNFSKGKSKATIIYLDSFSDSIKEKLIAKFSPLVITKSSSPSKSVEADHTGITDGKFNNELEEMDSSTKKVDYVRITDEKFNEEVDSNTKEVDYVGITDEKFNEEVDSNTKEVDYVDMTGGNFNEEVDSNTKVGDNVGVADEKFDNTKKETRAREALKANGKQHNRSRRLLRNNSSAPEFSKRFCYGNNIFDDKH